MNTGLLIALISLGTALVGLITALIGSRLEITINIHMLPKPEKQPEKPVEILNDPPQKKRRSRRTRTDEKLYCLSRENNAFNFWFEGEPTSLWYDKTFWLAFWAIVFFPVSLYGILRSHIILKSWKVLIIMWLIISAIILMTVL